MIAAHAGKLRHDHQCYLHGCYLDGDRSTRSVGFHCLGRITNQLNPMGAEGAWWA